MAIWIVDELVMIVPERKLKVLKIRRGPSGEGVDILVSSDFPLVERL